MPDGDGRKSVRQALQGARVAPGAPRDRDEPRELGLPPECPVVPLGLSGDVRYYLDSAKQLIGLPAEKHGRLSLIGLFGRHADWLYRNYPRVSKEGATVGWRPEQAAEALIAACDRAGIWSAEDRERGRGAWVGEDGELILHIGPQVLVYPAVRDMLHAPARHAPGVIGRHVYPAGEAAGAPALDDDRGLLTAGEEVLDLLCTWSWRRGATDDGEVALDALLLLGWIGAAMVGGALPWRPVVWFTGDSGTGKSTLHEVINALFGDAQLHASDASAASLWQTLKHQTLPVIFDELEAREDGRKAQAVIELARLAPSGGKLMRGSDKHRAMEFTVRSCFAFSSVLIPPLKPQDRSRIAVLELGPLPAGALAPVLDRRALRETGARLRRRMIQGWSRFQRTFDWYRSELMRVGHSPRGGDQFGTLLACADLLLFADDVDPAQAAIWVARMGATDLIETGDDVRDPEGCLMHLLGSTIDPFRGGRRTLGEWAQAALGRVHQADVGEARRALGMHGMAIWREPNSSRQWLAVAAQHRGLSALFEGTHWASGSGTAGVWTQTLRRLPGAQRGGAVYFGGVTSRATLVPVELVPSFEGYQQPELGAWEGDV